MSRLSDATQEPYARIEGSLKLAVLGLLVERPDYGYGLRHRFLRRVGTAWRPSKGAFSQALKALERDGLICEPPEESDAAPMEARRRRGSPRVVYEVTPEGRRYYEAWMVGSCELGPPRDELHLRLAVARFEDLPRLIEITRELERECVARLEVLAADAPPFEGLDEELDSLEAFASVAARDCEAAMLSATVDHLHTLRKTMKWMLKHPERFERREGSLRRA